MLGDVSQLWLVWSSGEARQSCTPDDLIYTGIWYPYVLLFQFLEWESLSQMLLWRGFVLISHNAGPLLWHYIVRKLLRQSQGGCLVVGRGLNRGSGRGS